MSDYDPKYAELPDASIRRAIEGLLRDDFKEGYYLAEVLRRSDGKWLLILEPDMSARIGLREGRGADDYGQDA